MYEEIVIKFVIMYFVCDTLYESHVLFIAKTLFLAATALEWLRWKLSWLISQPGFKQQLLRTDRRQAMAVSRPMRPHLYKAVSA